MNYLSPQEMLYVHYRLAEELETAQGVKDLTILKKLSHYLKNDDVFPDRFSKASALLFAVTKKKPFLDLNIPSAVLLAKIFLSLNGSNFDIDKSSVKDFLKDSLKEATVEEIKKVILQSSTGLN